MYHVFGSLVYILTKDASRWIADRSNWTTRIPLPTGVIQELEFWKRNINVITRQNLVPDHRKPAVIIYSDASSTGCGAYVLGDPDTEMVHYWTEQEQGTSSTWRELKAVILFLNIHAVKLESLCVKWYTDNQAVPRIVYKGSMVMELNILAMEALQICAQHKISLSLDWVPRGENTVADDLSKVIDVEDWSIQDHIFQYLNKTQGPFSCDIFASNLTKKVPKFYSRYWCEGAAGVDAFAYSWAEENCWLVPPPSIIAKTLLHMQGCRAAGIMIVPRWCASFFWPILHNGQSWEPGIQLIQEYCRPKRFFKAGAHGNNVFSENAFQSNVLVLKINYRDTW
jgi:hypothetical protein